MQFDGFESGNFQSKLRRPLILEREIVLREDTGAAGQLIQCETLRELLDLFYLLLCQVEYSGGIGPRPLQHQGAKVFHNLHVDLAQVRAVFRKLVDEMQYGGAIEVSDSSDEAGDRARIGDTEHSLHLGQ